MNLCLIPSRVNPSDIAFFLKILFWRGAIIIYILRIHSTCLEKKIDIFVGIMLNSSIILVMLCLPI